MLNSVLVEGILLEDPDLTSGVYVFSIDSRKYFRDKKALREEINVFDVEVPERIYNNASIKKGELVRITGYLRQYKNGCCIIAEHVERRKQ